MLTEALWVIYDTFPVSVSFLAQTEVNALQFPVLQNFTRIKSSVFGVKVRSLFFKLCVKLCIMENINIIPVSTCNFRNTIPILSIISKFCTFWDLILRINPSLNSKLWSSFPSSNSGI